MTKQETEDSYGTRFTWVVRKWKSTISETGKQNNVVIKNIQRGRTYTQGSGFEL